MPATIQVILREDVPNVGSSGELVKVRPGFARNYLLPRKLASPATTAQVNRVNHEKAVALVRTEKMKKEFRELAGKLGALGLTQQQADAVLALSREVVEKVVWEVVPQLAEAIIKEEIARLTKEA